MSKGKHQIKISLNDEYKGKTRAIAGWLLKVKPIDVVRMYEDMDLSLGFEAKGKHAHTFWLDQGVYNKIIELYASCATPIIITLARRKELEQ